MYVQSTLGALLQGVSQQPARLRVPGQVTEQQNFVSDVSRGLTSRPATDFISVLDNAESGMRFYNLQLSGTDYIVGHKASELRVWNLDGTEENVNYQDGDAQDYVGTDMRFHVLENKVYVTNRNVEVEASTDADGYPFHAAIISSLGGRYFAKYSIKLTFSDTTTAYGEFTTGDSAGASATKANSETIMEELYDALVADGIPGTATITREDDIICIKDTAGAITVEVTDGEGGATLRTISDFCDDTDDLPRWAPEGTIVKVVGGDADEDDYWLRFNVHGVSTEGSGFGKEGVWEEWYDPTEPTDLELETMPHVLTREGGDFYFRRANWLGRRVGNLESNPFPSFVGNKVRDISVFESRLVFVAGGNVIMSRTNEPLDFFRKSAVALIDSDVIDKTSSKEGTLTLDWIVQFDRGLYLLSDPGKSQYVISGVGLTPSNASMVETTSYEMSGFARPVTTGRTMMFPFKKGSYSGVKEFFTNDGVATNGADTLTQVQDRYIRGNINYMATSSNFNILLVLTDSTASGVPNTMYVYEYLWESTNKVQSAWHKWRFAQEVVFAWFDNSLIYLIFKQSADVYALEVLDLNRLNDSYVGYHVCLDAKQVKTVASNKVTLTYPNAAFVQRTGTDNTGIEAVPELVSALGDTEYEYTFDADVVPNTATLYCGRRFTKTLTPTMPMMKNNQGQTISSAVIVVAKFLVHVEDTGSLDFVMSSPYRSTSTQTPFQYPLDDEPLDPDETNLKDGVIEITWGERADYSELTITSTDVRPATILEIEWEGQVTGAKRRV